MGIFSRLRQAASTVREIAKDAADVGRDLGRFAAKEARSATVAAAEDLAGRVAKRGAEVRDRLRPAVERAAKAVDPVAPRAARELRRAAAPKAAPPPAPKAAPKAAPPPAPKAAPKAAPPPPAPPEPPPKAGKRKAGKAGKAGDKAGDKAAPKAGKRKPSVVDQVIERGKAERAAAPPRHQRRGATQEAGLVRFGDAKNAYLPTEDRAIVDAVPNGAIELRAWLEDHAAPGTSTYGKHYVVAGQARWAEVWQPLIMQWDDRAGAWVVVGQAPMGTVAEAAANGRELAERYRTAAGPGATMITVLLPVRSAK
jgi:hypothetical protein